MDPNEKHHILLQIPTLTTSLTTIFLLLDQIHEYSVERVHSYEIEVNQELVIAPKFKIDIPKFIEYQPFIDFIIALDEFTSISDDFDYNDSVFSANGAQCDGQKATPKMVLEYLHPTCPLQQNVQTIIPKITTLLQHHQLSFFTHDPNQNGTNDPQNDLNGDEQNNQYRMNSGWIIEPTPFFSPFQTSERRHIPPSHTKLVDILNSFDRRQILNRKNILHEIYFKSLLNEINPNTALTEGMICHTDQTTDIPQISTYLNDLYTQTFISTASTTPNHSNSTNISKCNHSFTGFGILDIISLIYQMYYNDNVLPILIYESHLAQAKYNARNGIYSSSNKNRYHHDTNIPISLKHYAPTLLTNYSLHHSSTSHLHQYQQPYHDNYQSFLSGYSDFNQLISTHLDFGSFLLTFFHFLTDILPQSYPTELHSPLLPQHLKERLVGSRVINRGTTGEGYLESDIGRSNDNLKNFKITPPDDMYRPNSPNSPSDRALIGKHVQERVQAYLCEQFDTFSKFHFLPFLFTLSRIILYSSSYSNLTMAELTSTLNETLTSLQLFTPISQAKQFSFPTSSFISMSGSSSKYNDPTNQNGVTTVITTTKDNNMEDIDEATLKRQPVMSVTTQTNYQYENGDEVVGYQGSTMGSSFRSNDNDIINTQYQNTHQFKSAWFSNLTTVEMYIQQQYDVINLHCQTSTKRMSDFSQTYGLNRALGHDDDQIDNDENSDNINTTASNNNNNNNNNVFNGDLIVKTPNEIQFEQRQISLMKQLYIYHYYLMLFAPITQVLDHMYMSTSEISMFDLVLNGNHDLTFSDGKNTQFTTFKLYYTQSLSLLHVYTELNSIFNASYKEYEDNVYELGLEKYKRDLKRYHKNDQNAQLDKTSPPNSPNALVSPTPPIKPLRKSPPKLSLLNSSGFLSHLSYNTLTFSLLHLVSSRQFKSFIENLSKSPHSTQFCRNCICTMLTEHDKAAGSGIEECDGDEISEKDEEGPNDEDEYDEDGQVEDYSIKPQADLTVYDMNTLYSALSEVFFKTKLENAVNPKSSPQNTSPNSSISVPNKDKRKIHFSKACSESSTDEGIDGDKVLSFLTKQMVFYNTKNQHHMTDVNPGNELYSISNNISRQSQHFNYVTDVLFNLFSFSMFLMPNFRQFQSKQVQLSEEDDSEVPTKGTLSTEAESAQGITQATPPVLTSTSTSLLPSANDRINPIYNEKIHLQQICQFLTLLLSLFSSTNPDPNVDKNHGVKTLHPSNMSSFNDSLTSPANLMESAHLYQSTPGRASGDLILDPLSELEDLKNQYAELKAQNKALLQDKIINNELICALRSSSTTAGTVGDVKGLKSPRAFGEIGTQKSGNTALLSSSTFADSFNTIIHTSSIPLPHGPKHALKIWSLDGSNEEYYSQFIPFEMLSKSLVNPNSSDKNNRVSFMDAVGLLGKFSWGWYLTNDVELVDRVLYHLDEVTQHGSFERCDDGYQWTRQFIWIIRKYLIQFKYLFEDLNKHGRIGSNSNKIALQNIPPLLLPLHFPSFFTSHPKLHSFSAMRSTMVRKLYTYGCLTLQTNIPLFNHQSMLEDNDPNNIARPVSGWLGGQALIPAAISYVYERHRENMEKIWAWEGIFDLLENLYLSAKSLKKTEKSMFSQIVQLDLQKLKYLSKLISITQINSLPIINVSGVDTTPPLVESPSLSTPPILPGRIPPGEIEQNQILEDFFHEFWSARLSPDFSGVYTIFIASPLPEKRYRFRTLQIAINKALKQYAHFVNRGNNVEGIDLSPNGFKHNQNNDHDPFKQLEDDVDNIEYQDLPIYNNDNNNNNNNNQHDTFYDGHDLINDDRSDRAHGGRNDHNQNNQINNQKHEQQNRTKGNPRSPTARHSSSFSTYDTNKYRTIDDAQYFNQFKYGTEHHNQPTQDDKYQTDDKSENDHNSALHFSTLAQNSHSNLPNTNTATNPTPLPPNSTSPINSLLLSYLDPPRFPSHASELFQLPVHKVLGGSLVKHIDSLIHGSDSSQLFTARFSQRPLPPDPPQSPKSFLPTCDNLKYPSCFENHELPPVDLSTRRNDNVSGNVMTIPTTPLDIISISTGHQSYLDTMDALQTEHLLTLHNDRNDKSLFDEISTNCLIRLKNDPNTQNDYQLSRLQRIAARASDKSINKPMGLFGGFKNSPQFMNFSSRKMQDAVIRRGVLNNAFKMEQLTYYWHHLFNSYQFNLSNYLNHIISNLRHSLVFFVQKPPKNVSFLPQNHLDIGHYLQQPYEPLLTTLSTNPDCFQKPKDLQTMNTVDVFDMWGYGNEGVFYNNTADHQNSPHGVLDEIDENSPPLGANNDPKGAKDNSNAINAVTSLQNNKKSNLNEVNLLFQTNPFFSLRFDPLFDLSTHPGFVPFVTLPTQKQRLDSASTRKIRFEHTLSESITINLKDRTCIKTPRTASPTALIASRNVIPIVLSYQSYGVEADYIEKKLNNNAFHNSMSTSAGSTSSSSHLTGSTTNSRNESELKKEMGKNLIDNLLNLFNDYIIYSPPIPQKTKVMTTTQTQVVNSDGSITTTIVTAPQHVEKRSKEEEEREMEKLLPYSLIPQYEINKLLRKQELSYLFLKSKNVLAGFDWVQSKELPGLDLDRENKAQNEQNEQRNNINNFGKSHSNMNKTTKSMHTAPPNYNLPKIATPEKVNLHFPIQLKALEEGKNKAEVQEQTHFDNNDTALTLGSLDLELLLNKYECFQAPGLGGFGDNVNFIANIVNNILPRIIFKIKLLYAGFKHKNDSFNRFSSRDSTTQDPIRNSLNFNYYIIDGSPPHDTYQPYTNDLADINLKQSQFDNIINDFFLILQTLTQDAQKSLISYSYHVFDDFSSPLARFSDEEWKSKPSKRPK